MGKTNKFKKAEDIANCVIDVLTERGVGCYIWRKATTGSVYIRFDDNRIGEGTERNNVQKMQKGKFVYVPKVVINNIFN